MVWSDVLPLPALESLSEFIVPDYRGVYFLGCFAKRVTFFAQQSRALNLVDGLISKGTITERSRIAIIGGGAAGMTAAAAIAVGMSGKASIHLYESKEHLVHLQEQSQRLLHPHLYDWPFGDWENDDAGLPLLNWKAGEAKAVAESVFQQFCDVEKAYPQLILRLNRPVADLESNGHGEHFVRVLGEARFRGPYDVLILAVGFGYEREISSANPSYWRDPGLFGTLTVPDIRKDIFISGNGDGGLVDFMLAAFNVPNHVVLCMRILKRADLEEVKERLRQIEERAWQAAEPVNLRLEYERLIRPILPEDFLSEVETWLRPNVRITFHTVEVHTRRTPS